MSSTILYEPTPNPNSLKFIAPGKAFPVEGMESFRSAEEASNHPLGRALFALEGVDNVFIMPAFLTVTKKPEADWDVLLPAIIRVLEEHLQD